MGGDEKTPASAEPASESKQEKQNEPRVKREIQWFVMLFHLHLHVFAVYAVLVALTEASLATNIFAIVLGSLSILSVTSGAHRLWAHRTYTGSWPLRLFFVIFQTLVGQGTVYNWVLNHRIHHKFHGTDNDPYNHKKGFFYSHFRCHLYSNGSNYDELVKEIDMSDMENDGIVMFQKRFYWVLLPIIGFLLPVNAPVEYWDETIFNSICVLGVLRYTIVLHAAWLVNSAELVWGLQPENNYSTDTNWIFFINKSYWPHYHYMLPWDYQSGEFGKYGTGCSTTFIRLCAVMGWATELQTIDSDSVKRALGVAVTTNKPIVECLTIEGKRYSQSISQDHLLQPPKD